MQIYKTEVTFGACCLAILNVDPVLDCSQVVTQMKLSCRLDTREYDLRLDLSALTVLITKVCVFTALIKIAIL